MRRPSPSRRRRRRRHRRRHQRCRLPRSPPTPLATPTHPLRPDMRIVALSDGLIVVYISFRPSPALLPRYFRYSAASLAEVPQDPWPSPPRG